MCVIQIDFVFDSQMEKRWQFRIGFGIEMGKNEPEIEMEMEIK